MTERLCLTLACTHVQNTREVCDSVPDHLGVFADDVQLEHVPALHTLHQSERHLQGATERLG